MANVFGATSTTEDVLSGVDLQGKRVLVTGDDLLRMVNHRALARPLISQPPEWQHPKSVTATLLALNCAHAECATGHQSFANLWSIEIPALPACP